jgi:hypothetical protein
MTLPHQPTLNDFFFLFLIINEFLLKQIDRASFPKGSSIGCELRLIKRRSLVRIPLSLILCGHVKKKKKKDKASSSITGTKQSTIRVIVTCKTFLYSMS